MHILKNTHIFSHTHSYIVINTLSTLSCDTPEDLKKKQQKDSKSYNYCSIKSIDKLKLVHFSLITWFMFPELVLELKVNIFSLTLCVLLPGGETVSQHSTKKKKKKN